MTSSVQFFVSVVDRVFKEHLQLTIEAEPAQSARHSPNWRSHGQTVSTQWNQRMKPRKTTWIPRNQGLFRGLIILDRYDLDS